jgi:hypothetical protein
MKQKYEVTVLVGTVYTAEIEAESLEKAREIVNNFDPHQFRGDGLPVFPEFEEAETDRTFIIGHHYGRTAFGFGHEWVRS